MPLQEVLPNHSPNEGRLIWNANDQNLILRIDSLALNVKASEFGARGDGTADDLPALQSAIDACAQSGGGYVFLPVGTYVLKSGTLLLRDNVHIFGAGMFNSVLRLGDGVNKPVISDEGHAPNDDSAFGRVQLANFAIDGNRSGNPEGQEGILTTAYFSTFDNLLIHECGTHGIRMGKLKLNNASSQNRVSGCRIYDCNGAGIYVDVHSIDHNITENYIYRCDVGVLIKNGGVRVVNNDIFSNQDAAIKVNQTSYGLVIASNDLNGNGRHAIQVSRTTQITQRTWSQFLIVGNTILGDDVTVDNEYDGIFVETSVESGISNLTVVANKIYSLEIGKRFRFGINFDKNVTFSYCAANHIFRTASGNYNVGSTCTQVEIDSLGGGALPAPVVPESGNALVNTYPVAVHIYLSGEAIRDVLIDNKSTGVKSGNYFLPAGKSIKVIYDQVPTWTWFSN